MTVIDADDLETKLQRLVASEIRRRVQFELIRLAATLPPSPVSERWTELLDDVADDVSTTIAGDIELAILERICTAADVIAGEMASDLAADISPGPR